MFPKRAFVTCCQTKHKHLCLPINCAQGADSSHEATKGGQRGWVIYSGMQENVQDARCCMDEYRYATRPRFRRTGEREDALVLHIIIDTQ
jgi:hypothetical protein